MRLEEFHEIPGSAIARSREETRRGACWVPFAKGGEVEQGREPIAKWLDRLSEVKRDAVLTALEHVLGRLGTEVCESEWGKNLGTGLYEFRVRHTAEEPAAMFGGQVPGLRKGQAILLRVFFSAYGRRVILLLGGYDNGQDASERGQQREIATARRRLANFRSRSPTTGRRASR